jgi:8-oxo-dGTP pyrophosphatase MutT (NUDIX family)
MVPAGLSIAAEPVRVLGFRREITMTVSHDTSNESLRSDMTTRRAVVAAVLTFGGHVCIFRRSRFVGSDRGMWHCITGYLPEEGDPLDHALAEIEEETGLSSAHLKLMSNNFLSLQGQDGHTWEIHTFHFSCDTNSVQLNWENDAYHWTPFEALAELETVNWFSAVLASLPSIRPTLAAAGRQ